MVSLANFGCLPRSWRNTFLLLISLKHVGCVFFFLHSRITFHKAYLPIQLLIKRVLGGGLWLNVAGEYKIKVAKQRLSFMDNEVMPDKCTEK